MLYESLRFPNSNLSFVPFDKKKNRPKIMPLKTKLVKKQASPLSSSTVNCDIHVIPSPINRITIWFGLLREKTGTAVSLFCSTWPRHSRAPRLKVTII